MLHKVCNNAAEDWQLCCGSLAIMLLRFCNTAAIYVQQCFPFGNYMLIDPIVIMVKN